MARRLRVAAGGIVYHVLNRAVGRGRIFRKVGPAALRRSVVRVAPFGDDAWTRKTAKRLSVESSLRPSGT